MAAFVSHTRHAMIRNSDGYTLMELFITMMIVGILATVAAPQATGLMRTYRLSGAGQVVWGDLHKARLMAIKESRTIRVDFTATAYSLVRVDTAEVAFSRNVALEYPGITLGVTPNAVTFTSAGLLASATRNVQIQSTAGTKGVTILPTGRIGNPT
jgi:type IV fimbrial biogenesis protein FimT